MLTRLKVSGFKNLVDVDIRFGPFTCIAGANGVGKSNLFDAIHFLSSLANSSLLDGALSVRDEGGRLGDVRQLFHRVGDQYDDLMSFETEMIIPATGEDDLGQAATASITFVKYSLVLRYRRSGSNGSSGGLAVEEEELTPIRLGDAPKSLLFPHTASTWRKSLLTGRRGVPFISTQDDAGERIVLLHQDGGSSGKPSRRLASSLPRTILSVVNAAESPTAAIVKKEMQSWRMLQLEPGSLRQSNSFTAPTRLATDGAYLASTLYRLAGGVSQEMPTDDPDPSRPEPQVYTQVANRLSELIDDVWEIDVDRDERRELLTLLVADRDGTSHPAMSLSDGTLRFLALAVLELDPQEYGLICLEEPENGIHPERIPAIIDLLRDIATDTDEPVGPDNPLRQVIINTHSPSVVGQVPEDALVVAELAERVSDGRRFKALGFSCLASTWRQNAPEEPKAVSRGKLLSYLRPILPDQAEDVASPGSSEAPVRARRRRVVDNPELGPLFSRERDS